MITAVLGWLALKLLPYAAALLAAIAAVLGYGAKKKAEGAKRALDQVARNNADVISEVKREQEGVGRLSDDELADRLSKQQRGE